MRKLVSEATELPHICNGTLDQVQAIALVRAFDPGAWVRIAFDVRFVASIFRGEPFVKSKLQLGQTFQLAVANTVERKEVSPLASLRTAN